jgi:hypothetical protein
MTAVATMPFTPAPRPVAASRRAEALADRLEQGARALEALACMLTDAEWQVPLGHDPRPVGVVVHHVASMYPLEMDLALVLAGGKPIDNVTWAMVDDINARHAREHAGARKAEAMALLRENSAAAAAAIRMLADEQLDAAAPVSLYDDAPLTCQFFLEDHPVRHSFHHLAGIRAALAVK